jgi:hypothetical protein
MASTAADFKSKAEELKNKLDNFNPQHKEGRVAKTIEDQTSKIPSDVYLWAAVGAIGVSLVLKLMKKDDEALFVGQWPAPFLLLGLYNKLVKLEGSD